MRKFKLTLAANDPSVFFYRMTVDQALMYLETLSDDDDITSAQVYIDPQQTQMTLIAMRTPKTKIML